MTTHALLFEKPAEDWNEAIPVGNGRLGAMMYGQPRHERLQLNEDSSGMADQGTAITRTRGRICRISAG